MAPEIVQRQEYDGKLVFFMLELNRNHVLSFPYYCTCTETHFNEIACRSLASDHCIKLMIRILGIYDKMWCILHIFLHHET